MSEGIHVLSESYSNSWLEHPYSYFIFNKMFVFSRRIVGKVILELSSCSEL